MRGINLQFSRINCFELSDEKADRIAINPASYKESEYPGTRVASMGHFSLFYRVSDENIIITAFWDNRQNPKKLLEMLRGGGSIK